MLGPWRGQGEGRGQPLYFPFFPAGHPFNPRPLLQFPPVGIDILPCGTPDARGAKSEDGVGKTDPKTMFVGYPEDGATVDVSIRLMHEEPREQGAKDLPQMEQDQQGGEELPECPNHYPSSFVQDDIAYHGYCPTCTHPAGEDD